MMHEMPVERQFAFGGKVLDGAMLAYTMLAAPLAIAVLIPLLVATTTGGIVAAEARAGTLRYLLIRPVSRLRLLTAKLLAGWLHAAGLTILMGAFALGVGYLVFGGGDLLVVRKGLVILPESVALLRLAEAYLLASLGMCAVASIALLLSVICDNPLTAAGVTVAFLLVSATLKVIPYFEWLEPHLLTAHLTLYNAVIANKPAWPELSRSLAYVAAYAVGPFIAAALIFCRKDMTC
jgi:ABC-2 type transport system permease protein